MAKPAPFFPLNALPTIQEFAEDLDWDNLGVAGAITQKANVILTATYAAAGAITITVVGAFATWPSYGVIENLTTLEQISWTRVNADSLVVNAQGRARNGTAAAGGSIGHSIRFIERRGLGRWQNQAIAELVAHDDFLRGSICINEAINGNMLFAQRYLGAAISTGTPSITAAQSYCIDRMFCRPAGAAVTVQPSTTVPNTDSELSAQINGAASVTTVNFGQRFEARRAKRLRKKLTFSAYIHNVTGAAFIPKIQLYTPTNADNFGAMNGVALDVALQSCADNAWTRVSYTFDPSGYTDIAKGFELSIQIPSGSCVAGDTIRVSQFQLERGSAATAFADAGDLELIRCERFYEKSAKLTSTTQYATDGRILWSTGANLTGANICMFTALFKTRKRVLPTVTIYDNLSASAKVTGINSGGSSTAGQNYLALTVGEVGFDLQFQNTSFSGILYCFTADAEL